MTRAFVLGVVAACGATAPGPVAPQPALGPPGATPVGDTASPQSATPPAQAVPGCLPPVDPAHPYWLDFARVADRWLACADDRHDALGPCWSVDASSGALVTVPKPLALPGYGYSLGNMLVVDGVVSVDLAGDTLRFVGGAERPVHDPKAKNAMPAGVGVAWLWAAGETAYLLGNDAALYMYAGNKPSQPPFFGLRSGGVGVSDGQIVIHEHALSRLTAMDGLTHRTTRGRNHRDEPCHPDDDYALGHEPEPGSACGAHLAAHYRPYLGATIVADGDGYVGIVPPRSMSGSDIDARGAVFRLDDHLAEVARAPIAVCSGP